MMRYIVAIIITMVFVALLKKKKKAKLDTSESTQIPKTKAPPKVTTPVVVPVTTTEAVGA